MILHVHVEIHWAYRIVNPLLNTDAIHPRPSCVFFCSEDEPRGEKRRQLHKNISVVRATMQMRYVGFLDVFFHLEGQVSASEGILLRQAPTVGHWNDMVTKVDGYTSCFHMYVFMRRDA